MNLDPRLFQPSGLNDRFHGQPGLPFAEYIKNTQTMIEKARVDLTPTTTAKIIQANSPFKWSSHNSKRGILLVHGLYDSPFTLRDVGQSLHQQGFAVQSILLPGHGTVPGDLLNVTFQEWLKAIDYAVDAMSEEFDEIFIVGYSMGGALSIYKALYDPRVRGLILFCPAIQLRHHFFISWRLEYHHYLSWLQKDKEWYKKRSGQEDYTKYESFTFNAALQIHRIIQATRALQKNTTLTIPIFMVLSQEDDVISSASALNFFLQQNNPRSRLLYYTNSTEDTPKNARIIQKSSKYPEQNILSFSHVCLPFVPENPHYGQHGDYQDFLRYPGNKPLAGKEICLGSTREDHQKYILQRLTYNPDFSGMMEELGGFLKC